MKNRIGTALLSLLIAFGIWIYVVSVVAPESERTYYDVPVKLHGDNVLKSRNLMLVSDENMQLDLQLSGTRTDLNKLSSANITVIADLSGITTAGEHTVHYSVSYPGSISSSITVLSPESQTVTVRVVEWAQKEVPIEVEYTGQLPDDFTADKKNVALDRNVVTVSGAKEEVDRVEKATITIDLTDQMTDIDQVYDLTFRDASGKPVELVNASADSQQVTVVLKINMIKTLNIIVKIMPGGGLTEADATCVPRFDQLVVSGPASILVELSDITVPVYIGELDESGTVFWDIRLPEGVTNETGITQVPVEVTIPKLIRETFEIDVSQYLPAAPEGMEMELGTITLNVIVEGRAHRLENITAEDIRLVIDLSNPVEGEAQYPVTIETPDGVEVIGTYTVKITLSEASRHIEPED